MSHNKENNPDTANVTARSNSIPATSEQSQSPMLKKDNSEISIASVSKQKAGPPKKSTTTKKPKLPHHLKDFVSWLNAEIEETKQNSTDLENMRDKVKQLT